MAGTMWTGDIMRLSQSFEEMNAFARMGRVDTHRLAHFALQLIVMRQQYERCLDVATDDEQKATIRRILANLDTLEQQIVVLRQIQVPPRSPFTLMPALAVPWG